MKNPITTDSIYIEKLVYGGQGIGTTSDGKKIFAWGVLPEETAQLKIIKNKRSWAEGVAESIENPSLHRVEPRDPESYLSTSPWQILDYEYENSLKEDLIIDQFAQHGISVKLHHFTAPEDPYEYRNKVEFSWWWSNETSQLDLAFFKRGTHTKQPVAGTSLAHPEINQAALKIRDFLRAHSIEAYALKSLLIRSNQAGEVSAALYVKDKDFKKLDWNIKSLDVTGLVVHYSDPKSPASISTRLLHSFGDTQLTDAIMDKQYYYSVDGFFQVNIPMYEKTLQVMAKFIDKQKPLLDLYSGVGSIGLSLASAGQKLTLIETDKRCIEEAKQNAASIKPATHIIHSESEKALEYIQESQTLIVDPPRAGLHQKVIDKILETNPETLLYLSCNPATQARDIAMLQDKYAIEYAHGFNFFPRTPHIENLITLKTL